MPLSISPPTIHNYPTSCSLISIEKECPTVGNPSPYSFSSSSAPPSSPPSSPSASRPSFVPCPPKSSIFPTRPTGSARNAAPPLSISWPPGLPGSAAPSSWSSSSLSITPCNPTCTPIIAPIRPASSTSSSPSSPSPSSLSSASSSASPAPPKTVDAIPPNAYFGLVKVRDVIRTLETDGWVLARTRGSHRQYKHPLKRGLVTVAGKPGDDLAPGTLNSILKQAGLK